MVSPGAQGWNPTWEMDGTDPWWRLDKRAIRLSWQECANYCSAVKSIHARSLAFASQASETRIAWILTRRWWKCEISWKRSFLSKWRSSLFLVECKTRCAGGIVARTVWNWCIQPMRHERVRKQANEWARKATSARQANEPYLFKTCRSKTGWETCAFAYTKRHTPKAEPIKIEVV